MPDSLSGALPDATGVAELLRVAEGLTLTDPGQAEGLLGRALELSRAAGDGPSEALALVLTSTVHFYRADYPQAQVAAAQALELARAHGVQSTEVRALGGLGANARAQGHHGQAMQHYADALRLAQDIGDGVNEVRVLINIGVLRMTIGEYALALDVQRRAAQRAQDLGHVPAHEIATVNLVVCHHHLGEHAQALALAEAHLPAVRELGLVQVEVVMQGYLAHTLIALNDLPRAEALARGALPLAEQIGHAEQQANLLGALGRALLLQGDVEGALEHLQRGLEIARSRALLTQERDLLGYLGEAHAAGGDWAQAYGLAREHQALAHTLHAQQSERLALVLGAQMQVELHRQEAEAERRRSRELARVNADLRRAQARLAHRADHDPLTGLANRTHFQATLERRLRGRRPLGVVFIDLDGFKHVNDSLGHDVGDGLLRVLARRLSAGARRGDLVARLGGDEFTLLLPGLGSAEAARARACEVLLALGAPCEVAGHRVQVTASVGVALAPRDGQDALTLQKHADVAMYRAKHAGKNAVCLYGASAESEGDQTPG